MTGRRGSTPGARATGTFVTRICLDDWTRRTAAHRGACTACASGMHLSAGASRTRRAVESSHGSSRERVAQTRATGAPVTMPCL